MNEMTAEVGKLKKSIQSLIDLLPELIEGLKELKPYASTFKEIVGVADAIGNIVSESFGSMEKAVQKLDFGTPFKKAGDSIEEAFNYSGKKAKAALESMGDGLKKLSDVDFTLMVSTAKSKIGDWIVNMKRSFVSFRDNVKDTFSGLWNNVLNGFVNFKDNIASFRDTAKETFSRLWTSAQDGFDSFRMDLKDLPSIIKDKFSQIGPSLKEFGSNALENIKSLPQKLKSGIGSLGDTLKNVAGNAEGAFASMGEKANAFMGKVGESVKDGLTKVGKFADVAGKFMAKAFAFGGIAIVVGLIAGLVLSFKELMEEGGAFKDKVDALWGGITEKFGAAVKEIETVFKKLIVTITGGDVENLDSSFADGMMVMVQGIIDFLSESIDFVSGIITGVLGYLTEIWEKYGAGILSFIEDARQVISTVIEYVGAIFSAVIEGAKAIFEGFIEIVLVLWNMFGEDIMNSITIVFAFFKGIFEGIVNVVKGVMDIVVGIFKGDFESVKKGFAEVWEGIKGIFSTVGEFFTGVWNTIKSIFTKIAISIGDAISGAVISAINGVIGFVEGIVNGVVRGINAAIGLINKIPGVSIGYIAQCNFRQMADGGFVDAGQMFIAREAGPELVGRVGSHTAVMNNNQIVDSVSSGVYKAVMAAMGGGNGKDITLNAVFTMDGDVVGRNVIKYHNGVVKRTGASPLLV